MHQSDLFAPYENDAEARFGTQYDRVAKQTDDEFLERYNGDLDAQLIFAGLFSAVSASFIVQMEGDLQPDPNATTNALLAYLAQQSNNITSAPVIIQMALKPWNGPTNTVVWTQALAYLSLGLSLLAAFGAVLGSNG
ncbi:hypothetical protein M422DRAFT_155311 [Sphaerobolus stellatus SS14]|nr:hypothetical protein M422DRAFT_155311 [Sphaerobolus stellatus SS14]